MKEFFVIITLLVLFLESHAQSERNKIVFGIKGGYNHTVITGREKTGSKTGFIGSTIYGSLFGEKGIGDNKFLSAGLTYSWVNDWNFVEMAIHLRQLISSRLSVFAGPKLDVAADRFDKEKESDSRLLGISAEAGAQYDLNPRIISEVAYSIGITRNFNDAGFDINNGRRNNFRFGVGYRF